MARILMEEALVSIVPGYQQVFNESPDWQKEAKKIGYPILVKAIAGDVGAVRTPEASEDFYARSAVVTRAAAYGLRHLTC